MRAPHDRAPLRRDVEAARPHRSAPAARLRIRRRQRQRGRRAHLQCDGAHGSEPARHGLPRAVRRERLVLEALGRDRASARFRDGGAEEGLWRGRESRGDRARAGREGTVRRADARVQRDLERRAHPSRGRRERDAQAPEHAVARRRGELPRRHAGRLRRARHRLRVRGLPEGPRTASGHHRVRGLEALPRARAQGQASELLPRRRARARWPPRAQDAGHAVHSALFRPRAAARGHLERHDASRAGQRPARRSGLDRALCEA